MTSCRLKNLATSALIFLLSATSAIATDASEKGNRIISAVDQHEDGYEDLRSSVTMVLENAKGRKRQRHLDIYTLELTPIGDRRKFVFKQPADINGTAILVHSNVIQNDDHWIYLPAFKRVKRISSRNKSSPFVGSEFSYEDLSSQETEKYSNRYIETIVLGEKEIDVVERVPNFPHSAYSKLLVYVDQENNRYRKTEYFNKSGKHTKTQHFEEYRLFSSRYLLATRTVMENHLTKKRTSMLWEDIRLKTAQLKNHFSPTALKR